MNKKYREQVSLLIRLLPITFQEPCFALKGGTAINLFIRDLPRLSVDIDLVYLPLDDRNTALKNVRDALSRITRDIESSIAGSKVLLQPEDSGSLRLFVDTDYARVKIELSPVLRGSVSQPVLMQVSKRVESEFGYAEVPVLAMPDLYAGKICAALDRQHPRDLFDIKLLLENEGISEEMRKTFLVYLISHSRPISELLQPTPKDIHRIFESEFVEMTEIPVTLEALVDARRELIEILHKDMTTEEKQFLLSFKAQQPDWSLLGLKNVEQLPAIRWKLLNLQKMPKDKYALALKKLEEVLFPEK